MGQQEQLHNVAEQTTLRSHQKLQSSTDRSNHLQVEKNSSNEIEIENHASYGGNLEAQAQTEDILTTNIHRLHSIDSSHAFSPVRMLQRQASPEINATFKFGMAPKLKSNSYNLKNPATDDRITQERFYQNLPSLMTKKIYKGDYTSAKESVISQNSALNPTQISLGFSASIPGYIHPNSSSVNVSKAISSQILTRSLVQESQDDISWIDGHSKLDQNKNSSKEIDSQIGTNLKPPYFREKDDAIPNKCAGSMSISSNDHENSKVSPQKSTLIEKSNTFLPLNLSGGQLIKSHEKTVPRLPSRKPRIKKPFPEASNLVTYRSAEKQLDSVQKTSNINDTEIDPYMTSNTSLTRSQILDNGKISNINSGHIDFQSKGIEKNPQIFKQNAESQKNLNTADSFPLPIEKDVVRDELILDYSPNTRKRSGKFESINSNHNKTDSLNQNPTKSSRRPSTSVISIRSESNIEEYPHKTTKSFIEPQSSLGQDGNHQSCRTHNNNYSAEVDEHSQLTSPATSQVLSEFCVSRSPSECQKQQSIKPIRLNDLNPDDTNTISISRKSLEKRRRRSQEAKNCFGTSKIDKRLKPASIGWNYKKLIESHNMFVDLSKDCEEKSEIIEKQKAQITEMEKISRYSDEKIRQLENDAVILKEKSQRLSNIWKKHKDHISEIIICQKDLKEQKKEIEMKLKPTEDLPKNLVTEIKGLKNDVQVANEKVSNIYQSLSKVSKDIKETNKHLVQHNVELIEEKNMYVAQNQDLEIKNEELKHLTSQQIAEKSILTSSIEVLKVQIKELEDSKVKLIEQVKNLDRAEQKAIFGKTHLEEQLQNAINTAEIKNQLIENLQRERDELEKRTKELECFRKYQVEQSGLIKQTPTEVASELMKKDGLLSMIINTSHSTREKIDAGINDLKARNTDSSVSFLKLMKDLSSRIEISLEKQDDSSSILGKINKITEDLTKSLYDLHQDHQASSHLSLSISSLQRANETLVKERLNLENELRLKSIDLNELKSKLKTCEDDLRTKITELNLNMALPKEDSQIKAQVEDLKTKNNELQRQLKDMSKELSNLEEKKLKEDGIKGQKINELEQMLSDARLRILGFEDEKISYIAKKDQDNKNLCQELTKKSESSKATMRLKLQTEVKNLEQKLKDRALEVLAAEKELKAAREEISEVREDMKKLQDENNAQQNTCQKLEKELISYKDQFLLQVSQIELLENQSFQSQTKQNLDLSFCSVLKEMSELQTLFETIKKENLQLVQIMLADRQGIIELHSLNTQPQQIDTVNLQNKSFQKSLENFKDFIVHANNGFNQNAVEIRTPMKELNLSATKCVPSASMVQGNSLDSSTEARSTGQEFSDPFQCYIEGNLNSIQIMVPSTDVIKANKEPTLPFDNCHASDTENYSQSLENMIDIKTPMAKDFPHIESNSSSLTDVELMINNLPSTLCQDKLHQEYEKTRNSKKAVNHGPQSASPSNIGSQRTGKCNLKRNSDQKGGNKGMSHQQNKDVDDEGSSKKKRARKANNPTSATEQSKRRRSGLSRPTMSSLRNQIAQENDCNSSSENQRSEFDFEIEPTVQPTSPDIQQIESNVKQRRQEVAPHMIGEFTNRKGAKSRASSRIRAAIP
ncbi:hypothetical protein K3495_g1082 [Podosphaera aphanis]|nr:hypothetical protein K3495_g1082 [Podosphaera aphanis]